MTEPQITNLEEFLSPFSQDMQQLARDCRGLILSVRPNAIEQFDSADHLIGYGYTTSYRGMVCAIVIFKTYLNLMLARGASLPDPEGLLIGTGKTARHIRIGQSVELKKAGVRQLLEIAWQTRPRN